MVAPELGGDPELALVQLARPLAAAMQPDCSQHFAEARGHAGRETIQQWYPTAITDDAPEQVILQPRRLHRRGSLDQPDRSEACGRTEAAKS